MGGEESGESGVNWQDESQELDVHGQTSRVRRSVLHVYRIPYQDYIRIKLQLMGSRLKISLSKPRNYLVFLLSI